MHEISLLISLVISSEYGTLKKWDQAWNITIFLEDYKYVLIENKLWGVVIIFPKNKKKKLAKCVSGFLCNYWKDRIWMSFKFHTANHQRGMHIIWTTFKVVARIAVFCRKFFMFFVNKFSINLFISYISHVFSTFFYKNF